MQSSISLPSLNGSLVPSSFSAVFRLSHISSLPPLLHFAGGQLKYLRQDETPLAADFPGRERREMEVGRCENDGKEEAVGRRANRI